MLFFYIHRYLVSSVSNVTVLLVYYIIPLKMLL